MLTSIPPHESRDTYPHPPGGGGDGGSHVRRYPPKANVGSPGINIELRPIKIGYQDYEN